MQKNTADSDLEYISPWIGPERRNSAVEEYDFDGVEFAIIGAGFTGLSIALELLKGGCSVTVFEEKTVGFGASGRNGGFCTVGLSSPSGLLSSYGKAQAKEIWDFGEKAVNVVQGIIREENIDCEFVKSGRTKLASKQAHFENLRNEKLLLKKYFGRERHLLSEDELNEVLRAGKFFGGLYDQESAHLHPGKYVIGLADAVKKRGGVIVENCKVDSVCLSPNKKQVHLSHQRNTFCAEHAVIATNGYTGNIFSGLSNCLMPIGSSALITEPIKEDLCGQVFPKNNIYSTSQNFMNYFRLTNEKRLVFGGRTNLSTRPVPHETKKDLLKRFRDVLPELGAIAIDQTWSGILAVTKNGLPQVKLGDKISFAAGYCGHGVPISTSVGKCMARALMDDVNKMDSPLAMFSEKKYPFGINKPWILPAVGMYYRYIDHWR